MAETTTNFSNIIKDVKFCDEKITFRSDDGDIILNALGECCSLSWFEIPPETDIGLCVGKTYEGYCMTDEITSINFEKKTYFYDLTFANNVGEKTVLKIIMKNSSNGYYYGFIEETKTLAIGSPLECRKNQLLIITGLPGCGKTTFAKKLLAGKTKGVLLDDVNIGSFETITNIRNNLKNGLRVIVATPLFCDFYECSKFVMKLQLTNPMRQIRIYCFDPNVEQSIANLTNRETPENLQSFITSVEHLKSKYTTFDKALNKSCDTNIIVLPTFESEEYF